MSFFDAILLGIIQGLTEFFPISSSGHLVIAEQLLGIETNQGVLFNLVLHIGTLIAIFSHFHKDVLRLLYSYLGIGHDLLKNIRILMSNIYNKQKNSYRKILKSNHRKLSLLVLITIIPTAFIGIAMRTVVMRLSDLFFVTGLGLLVTSLLLFIAGFYEKRNKGTRNMSWWNALIVGACQGVSVLPGISRFGTTITAGLISGYSKPYVLKFSILISIPAIIGAAVNELFKLPITTDGLNFAFFVCCILGAAASAVTGYFAIKIFIRVVKNGKLRYFAYYCFGAGALVLLANYFI